MTVPANDQTGAPARDPLRPLPVLLALIAIKLAILLADPNPRFFLWDSVTYLQGAVGGALPRDRSFLYSLLIAAIAVPAHSLHALVIVQTLAGVASALLLYLILRVFLAVRFAFALAAAVVVALEPSQLFYERMVMAEAFGSVLGLGFIALVLAYIRDGRARWLPAVALCGICSVAFRLNGTAIVLLVSAGLPLLRWWFMPRVARRDATAPGWQRRLALHVAIALAVTSVVHVGYRHIVAEIAHTKPGYIGTEGLFLLGFVAPAVEETDFRGTGCPLDLLAHIDRPLADARTREYQLWGEAGLWAQMQRYCPIPEAAADTVAHRAFGRIGPRVLPMALATVAQYFVDDDATWRMNSDLGRKGMLPIELIEIAQKYFNLDVKPIAFTDTLTSVWFEHSRWWLTGSFLLAPVFAIWLAWRTRHDAVADAARLLAFILIGLFLTQFLLSPVIVFRYLHPFPPLLIACIVTMLGRSRTEPVRLARDDHDVAAESPLPHARHAGGFGGD